MSTGKTVLEKEIKKIFFKVHQEVFGKGPESLWIRIYQNAALFYIFKTLTKLEEFMVTMPGGIEEVYKLRATIIKNMKEILSVEIAAVSQVKVLGISMEFSLDSNVMFGAILFDEIVS